MQLAVFLLIAVSALIVLSGFSVFVGSRKNDKVSSAFFLISTIFGALWALSIANFLSLTPEQLDFAPISVLGIYTSALFLDTFLVGHIGWRYKAGKIITILFSIYSLFIAYLLVFKHELLYSNIVLSYEGNKLIFTNGWFQWIYLAFFSLISITLLGLLLYRITKTSHRGRRMGLMVFMVGLSFTGLISLIFDLLLTYWVTYDLIWVGPITMTATIVAYYYAILYYKVISLDTRWLKTLSYAIILASVAVAYMLIFFAIFTALFKVPNPSPAILILNLTMAAVIIFMMPIVNEMSAFVRSLIQTNKIDLAYVVRKMDRLSNQKVNLSELSDFLADHLHFAYVGMLVNGKLYGSSALPISGDELTALSNMKAPTNTIWQSPNKTNTRILQQVGISAVAELRDDNGKPIGQLLLGRPNGRMSFDRKDMIQLEMVISLAALIAVSSTTVRRRRHRGSTTKK